MIKSNEFERKMTEQKKGEFEMHDGVTTKYGSKCFKERTEQDRSFQYLGLRLGRTWNSQIKLNDREEWPQVVCI